VKKGKEKTYMISCVFNCVLQKPSDSTINVPVKLASLANLWFQLQLDLDVLLTCFIRRISWYGKPF